MTHSEIRRCRGAKCNARLIRGVNQLNNGICLRREEEKRNVMQPANADDGILVILTK